MYQHAPLHKPDGRPALRSRMKNWSLFGDNDTPRSMGEFANLAEALHAHARQQPDALAFRFLNAGGRGEDLISYRELDRAAAAIAASLRAQGTPADARALLLYPPGLDYIAALFGCFYAGVVAVPAYPPRRNRASDRVRELVAAAQPQLALTSPALLQEFKPEWERDPALAQLSWLALDHQQGAACASGETTISAGDIAFLQYTSGSTSAPKGVVLSHANLLHNVKLIAQGTGMDDDDHMIGWLPPYHDMGLIGTIIAPICRGLQATTLLAPGEFMLRPGRWLEAISRYRGSISPAPNFAYELCLQRVSAEHRTTLDLSSWRVALNGAERVRASTLERFSERFAPQGFRAEAMTPCYGLAEGTLAVTMKRPGQAPRVRHVDQAALQSGRLVTALPGPGTQAVVSCGAPLPDVALHIVDPDSGVILPEGKIGEIWLASPSVARGYWQDEVQSRETFQAIPQGAVADTQGFLRSGDLGYLDHGELCVTGRRKDLIIILGVNHYPDDIEATVEAAHPRLRAGGSFAFSIGENDEKLVLVCEVDRCRKLPAADIIASIRQAVAGAHELPVHEVVLLGPRRNPRTSSGKPQRQRCRQLYLQNSLQAVARMGVATDPQQAADPQRVTEVAQIMAKVLGVESVAADDNFFEIGGHSLMATQLVSRLSQAWHTELPVRSVFEAPSPAALAARYAERQTKPHDTGIKPVDRQGPLPMTHSQERMWFLHQLDPDSAAYNVCGALEIQGRLDVPALNSALQAAVDRHETLRTVFANVEGKPQPRILPKLKLSLLVEDLSRATEPAQTAAEHGSAFARRPFDLENGPLLRVSVYRLAEQAWSVVTSLHHIVSDAWSMGVLLNEVIRDYRDCSQGRPLTRPAAQLQYVDYAAWQRHWVESQRFDKELRFWRERLADAPVLSLPLDHPAASSGQPSGALEPLTLPAELFARVKQLAGRHGATPFMVMLAAFQLLLYRYSQQKDFVLGIPIANRNHPHSEQLIGTLVNTLALRADIADQDDFAALLAKTRQHCLDAYEHQNLPFERLVSELDLERRPGEYPLLQVMFDYQNPPMPPPQMDALQLRPRHLSRQASQFDLSLLIMDTELGQIAAAEYRSDRFDQPTIARLLEHYVTILESVTSDEGIEISRIKLLSERDRTAIIGMGSAPQQAPLAVRTVIDSIAEQARRSPDTVAVRGQTGAALSYAQLLEQVQELAARMAAQGVLAGDYVAVCLQRSHRLPVALLAVHWLGAAYIPIDPDFPPERIRGMLEDAGPRLLLVDTDSLAQHPELSRQALLSIDAPAAAAAQWTSVLRARAGETAYILYTSGSTGVPKGVVVPQRALYNFIESMAQAPGMRAGEQLLSLTTVSFDIAALEIFLPLFVGGTVTIAAQRTAMDGPSLVRLIESESFDLVQATPTTWRLLIESGLRGQPGLKALSGGEPLAQELADTLRGRCRELWNLYGPTETTIWSTIEQVAANRPLSIGHPIARTRVYILDQHGELAPPGVSGEITIGGAGVADGYHQRPQQSAEKFVDDPFAGEPGARMYRTGDIGRLRSDGRLECLGRLDQQVKVRGYRIELGEIEAALARQAGVQRCAVTTHALQAGDTRLIAYYVPQAQPLEAEVLLSGLQQCLPRYMIPAQFVALPALPTTANGKLDRKALPAPPAPQSLERQSVPAQTPTQRAIAKVWSAVLGVEQPGIHDDFFDIGHSLLAVRLFAGIEKELGIALPLATLFAGPTIAHLAATIDTPQEAEAAANTPHEFLVGIRTSGSASPLFCVHGAGGNVLNFAGIARYLPPTQPLYGIQARGLDGLATPFKSIEEMAQAYLRELRSVQPNGPYLLAGYCGGGIVAYEMAQRLQQAGETVAQLILIDAFRPGVQLKRCGSLRRLTAAASHGPENVLGRLRGRLQRSAEQRERQRSIRQHREQGLAVPHELRDHWLMDEFLRAVRGYQVQPYSGRVTALRASEVPEDAAQCAEPGLGWQDYVRGELEVLDVPGDHQTLADEPHLPVLSEVIQGCLKRASLNQA